MRVHSTNRKIMKRAKLVLFFWLIGWAMLKGQNPVLTVSPGGTMSVCPGTPVSVSANVANAFAGTTSYTVGDIPFSPYSIPGGTNVTMPDDTVLGPFPIGFQFCFYGNTYTQFYLGSNGWIGFSPGMTRAFTANSIPSTNMFVPRNCIMGPWMDFNPGIAGGPYIKYQTQGIAPYRRLVVQWLNVPLYQCIALKSTFQIVIFESTNIIEHHITQKPTCMAWAGGRATQGLHNLAGNDAITVTGRNAAVWTANNDGKRFTPNGPPSFTVNWTANGIPAGTGASTTVTSGPGNKRVIARVNFQCSNLILYDTLDINIGGASSAAFSVPSPVCAGQPANFTYTGGAAGTGAWTFGSGSPNSATGLGTQSSTWATPGTYPVTLNVTPSSGACLPSSLTQNVIVSAPPTSTFTTPASLCVNANGTITYTGNAPAGSTYSWNFGTDASPATASTAGPHAVSWSTAGSKTISLTITSGTCSSTTTNTVTVNAAPSASFTINPSPVCAAANTTVTFTGTAAAGSTYTWNFGLGASPLTASGVGPHTVSWGSSGTKTVGLTVTTSGCSATASQTVVVNPIPNSPFTLPASVCVGSNASISYSGSAAAPPGATYSWNVGGGLPAPGNVQGPFSVNWSTPGTKTVTLTVTQGGCSSAVTSQNITVNPAPTVAIAASPTTVCTGQTTALSVSGTAPAAGSTYNWNFGATATPSTSTSAGPVNVSWSNTGAFAPSLTVTTNGCTSAPASATVNVISPPSAAITIPASGCVGVPVTISATGPHPVGSTFTWNFGTGTVLSGSGAGPYSVQWASGGNQTVSLTVTSGGCSANSSSVINIRSGPTATFTAPSNLCANQNGTITFTGSAAAGATYSWNFGLNASPATANTVGPHSVSWTSPGNKTISLTVTDGGCAPVTFTQNVLINPGYTATYSLPASVCQNGSGTVTYTGNAPAGSTFAWNFGTGATPATATTAGPHNVTWATAGTSTVSLSVTAAGCVAGPSTQTIAVTAPPTSTFSLPTTSCASSPVSVTYTGNAAAGATYNWSFPGGTPATATGVGPHSCSWPSAGTYNVSLSVVQNGCTSLTTTNSIQILAAPTNTFSLPTSTCVGGSVSAAYTGNASAGATYSWNFGANATPATANTVGPHSVSWSTSGSKTVTLTVTDGGCAPVTVSQNITINTGYTTTFSLPSSVCQNGSGTITYTGNAPPGSTYAWNFGAGASPATATTVGPHNVTWSTVGTSTVSLSVTTGGCVAGPSTQTIAVTAPPTSTFSLPSTSCASSPVTLSYTGNAAAGATYNWSFPGGTPATATGIGPHSYSWPSAGTYNVSLSVVQNGCTSATTTNSIQVFDAPTNTFTLPANTCVGTPVAATYSGNATTGATYAWNFGVGATPATASSVGPHNVSWSTAGSKTVSLVVTQNGCSVAAVTRTITVNSAPTSTFTVTSPECVNEAAVATYTGNAGPSATYTWTYPNGSWVAGSGPGPLQLTWPNSGTQAVTLTVAENGCTSALTTQNVVIQASPTFTVSVPTYSGINTSTTVSYTGTPIAGATYTWNFDGGTVVSGSGVGPYQIEWATAGVKNISCTVISGACNPVTETAQTEVISAATVSFIAESPVCVNSPSTITFTGMSLPGAVFNWNFAGGTILSGSGAGPYEISWSTAGSKTITLSVTQFSVTSPVVSQTVVVNAIPTAAFSIPTFICLDQTASINYTGSNAATSTFAWDFDGGNVIGSASATNLVSFPAAGSYDVSLQVTQNGCASAALVQTIEVRPVPVAAFSVASSACTNAPVTVTFTGTAPVGASYTWNFGGATVLSGSGAGPYALSWSTAGAKTITLSVTQNQCTSAQASQSITINQTPVAAFTAVSSNCSTEPVLVTFTGTASPTATYNWDLGPASLVSGSGQGPLEATYSTTGTFIFGLTVVQNGCTATATGQSVTLEATPVVTFNLTDTTYAGIAGTAVFTGTAPSAATFSWDYPGAQWISGSATGPIELSWASAGTYAVELTVDNNGCVPPAVMDSIVVLPFPGASFSPENDTACVSTPMWITYNGTQVPNAVYNWDFDGATILSGSGVGPYQVTWSTPGIKNVTVSLSVNGLTGQPYSMELLLLDIPVASFSMPAEACAGEEVQLNYTSSTNVNALFQWTYDGGTAISGDETGSPIVRWDTSGVKTVSLSIADAMCISTPSIQQINIKALPVAEYSLDTVACRGSEMTVSFDGSAGVTADFTWDFGGAEILDGSAVGPFQIIWNTAGTYQVRLDITENGCSAIPAITEVVVRELPMAEAGSVPQICSGDTVRFSPFEDPSYSYSWSPAGGLSDDSIATPDLSLTSIHTYVENFTYTLRVFDGYCSSTDSVEVTLAPVPNAYFAHPAPQCMADHSVNLIGEGGFDATADYSWNLGPHAFTHSPNDKDQQGITFDTEGTHVISLVVSQYGCTSDAYLDSVVIHPNPVADFSASNVKGCLPLSPEFAAVPVAGSSVDYQWAFGDGNTGFGAEPGHIYMESGYMTVTLTITDDNGCSGSKTVPNFIQVLEQPIAGFRATPEILFIGVDELALTSLSQNALYSYYVINQDTILGATSTYNFNEPGEYPITQVVVNAAGCTDEITHIVKVEYGTEYYIPAAFTPNNDGKNDVFKVEGSEIQDFNLVIFDRWGHEIFSSSDISKGWDGKSPDSAQPVPEGVYIFRVEMKNKQNRDIIENGSVTLLR